MGILVSLSKSVISACLDVSEWGLLIFALIVVVGLVGEHKLPWWHKRYDSFVLLVVIGCSGELISDGGVFLFSRHLQTISDKELAAAIIKVGDAQKSADDAADDALSAKGSARQATKDAGTAQEELGEVQAQAEQLRKKLLDLEPRRLKVAQKTEFITKSKQGNIPTPLVVASHFNDNEALDFADDFVQPLTDAHWTPQRSYVSTDNKYGVLVATMPLTSVLAAPQITLLSGPLRAIGVTNKIITIKPDEVNTLLPPFQERVLYLIIGVKPPPSKTP